MSAEFLTFIGGLAITMGGVFAIMGAINSFCLNREISQLTERVMRLEAKE